MDVVNVKIRVSMTRLSFFNDQLKHFWITEHPTHLPTSVIMQVVAVPDYLLDNLQEVCKKHMKCVSRDAQFK